MPKKSREKKIDDLKAKSVDKKADRINGGAQPLGGPRTADPVNNRPRPSEPINT